MKTDSRELSEENDSKNRGFSSLPSKETSEKIDSSSSELVHVSEKLRGDIEMMNIESIEFVRQITAHPLFDSVKEKGISLGLTQAEVSTILSFDTFFEKDDALCKKAKDLHGDFLDRLSRAAQMGVSAFAIGSSSPSQASLESSSSDGHVQS